MSPVRRQHFVPQFYLAGFTATGSRDDPLHVTDLVQQRHWQARPAAVAHERDLYRFEGADADPDMFEHLFGRIEARTAEHLRRLGTSGQPPSGEDLRELLFFVALMATRVPRRRQHMTAEVDRLSKSILQANVASPEAWAATQERLRSQGCPEEAATSYEEAKRVAEEGRFVVDMPQNWHLDMIRQSTEQIFAALDLRCWRFVKSDEPQLDFICSDYPVSLVWIDEVPECYAPGFAIPGTEMSVPLTRQWALVGRFGPWENAIVATPETVATLNRRTAMRAGQVFSARDIFAWRKSDGQVGSSADLLAEVASRAHSGLGDKDASERAGA